MDIQLAALCDHAADYGGKMVVSGTFDVLGARALPVIHPQCVLALRVCLTPEDKGSHKLGINIIDEDGKAIDDKMPINADFPVEVPEGVPFFTRNLVMNFQGLKFEKAGIYYIDISIDGELAQRLPLRVVQVDQPQPN